MLAVDCLLSPRPLVDSLRNESRSSRLFVSSMCRLWNVHGPDDAKPSPKDVSGCWDLILYNTSGQTAAVRTGRIPLVSFEAK